MRASYSLYEMSLLKSGAFVKLILISFQKLAQKRRKQGQKRCRQEEEAQRSLEEDTKAAIAHNQRTNKVLLCHAAQNNADDNCRHRKAQLI